MEYKKLDRAFLLTLSVKGPVQLHDMYCSIDYSVIKWHGKNPT